jgi:CRISPR-associated protein Cmr6
MPDSSWRRGALDGVAAVSGSTHAGLWFDRYFDARGGNDAKRTLMEQTAQLGIPQAYRVFFDRYKAAIAQQANAQFAVAEVQGRMVIGTGDKGVAEAGITLHHTYGVPYIPGSALKGLVAAYAHKRLEGFAKPDKRRAPEKLADYTPYHILFGAENSMGYVTFFDALYIPGSAKQDRPLARDVITGHHPDYYVGNEPAPPADWDSPNPVPFLTATGRYLIAVAGPAQWVTTALTIIGTALRDIGIGAKTASGYGRMRLLDMDGRPWPLPTPSPVEDARQAGAMQAASPQATTPTDPPQVASFRQQIAQAQKNTLPNLVDLLEQLEVAPQTKRALAEALAARAHALKMTTQGKAWYQRLQRLQEEQP